MNTKQSTASDAQLVDRVRQNDQSAFGDIYDRYADDIYTFCRSRLRNDADAADAMQETFVRAATRMSQLRDPAKLRSWLFAIARNQIIATGKAASRAIGGEAMGEVIDLRAHVDQDLLQAEASAQLWDAAAGLSDRDQEVLELHLRHGLGGQALADAMGVSESHANVMMTRLRDRIATSLGGLLVARSGRDECDELNMLLAGWDGTFTIDLRGKVTRHIRSCEVCERTKTTALAAGAIMLPMVKAPAGLRIGTIDKMLEATKPAGHPGAGRETRWDVSVAGGTSASGGAVWHWREDGFPYPEEEPGVLGPITTGTSWLLATAIFVLVALLGAGAWLVLGNDPNVSVEVAGAVSLSSTNDGPTTTGETITSSSAADSTSTTDAALAPATSAVPAGDAVDDDAEVAAPSTTVAPTTAAPTTQTSTTAAPTTAVPTTAAPTTAAPTTAAPTTAAPTTAAPTTPAPTTAAPTTTVAPTTAAPTTATPTTATPTTAAPPPTTEEPPPTTEEPPNRAPVIRSAEATPLGVVIRNAGCNGELTQLVVEVVDDGEIRSVVASWAPSSDSPTISAELNGRGPSVYTAAIGPWTESGPQTIGVIVTDDRGATSTANASVRVAACPIGDFAG